MKLEPILGILGRFALVYGLLIVPWPGLAEGYTELFAAGGRALYASFGARGLVKFKTSRDDPRVATPKVKIVCADRRAIEDAIKAGEPNRPMVFGGTEGDSRLTGYLPTAFVVALILATPLALRRRLFSLFLGVLAVHAFVALRMAIALAYIFSHDPVPIITLGPFSRGALQLLNDMLNLNTIGLVVVPVLVWILVAARHTHWRSLVLGLPAPPEPAGAVPDGRLAAARRSAIELVARLVGWMKNGDPARPRTGEDSGFAASPDAGKRRAARGGARRRRRR